METDRANHTGTLVYSGSGICTIIALIKFLLVHYFRGSSCTAFNLNNSFPSCNGCMVIV